MRTVGTLAALCVLCAFVAAYTHPAQASEATQEHQSLTIAPEPNYYSDFKTHGPRGRIMRVARSYLGTTYRQKAWNCSDYTRQTFGEAVSVWMIDWDDKQIYYGYHPNHRKRGDLVFFDENGRDDSDGAVTHVAVFAGKDENGLPWVWQNSAYYREVVKTPLTWITRPDGKQAYVPRYTRRIR